MAIGFLSYIENFIDRLGIPVEAKEVILQVEKRIFSDEKTSNVFSELKTRFLSGTIKLSDALDAVGQLNTELGISEYTLSFVFLINCTDVLLENYKRKNIDEQIFWETMDDFRCKLLECHEVMGVWGTFIRDWFDGFFKMERFALGRFQYEKVTFAGDKFEKCGVQLNKGDPVYNFHIPSSGKPFDRAARIKSYRRAYDFFGFRRTGEKQIFTCHSWLLYKELEKILPESSKIVDFMHDFYIVSLSEQEDFKDAWRIFGKHHKLPLAQLPTDTSLRKAIVEHLTKGGKMGIGFGIIVFDGDRIIKSQSH